MNCEPYCPRIKGKLVQIQRGPATVSAPAGQRLLDLGFVPETRIRVVRRAPLGDPVLYDLRGTRLCLRRSEAAIIRVRPDGGDSAPT